MKNKTVIMKKISENISKDKKLGEQDKNKLWWESLPMTYVDWDAKNRIPKTRKDFLNTEKFFLTGNPFLIKNFVFNKFKEKKVLEIGCGSGAASCLFAKNGAKVTSVDITNEAIKMTKKNAKLQNVTLVAKQCDAEKLSFEDNSFDYVFSWGVLHHSKNTLEAFKQVWRVLKKDGRGLLMVYNKNSARYYINGLYWLILKGKIFRGYNLKSVQSFYTDGFYHRHFTPKEFEKELKKIGLKCKKISITHMGGYRMLPKFVPISFENWIKNNFGWLLVAEFEKE